MIGTATTKADRPTPRYIILSEVRSFGGPAVGWVESDSVKQTTETTSFVSSCHTHLYDKTGVIFLTILCRPTAATQVREAKKSTFTL